MSKSFVGSSDSESHTACVTDDELVVALMDGRTISAPLAWFPRLFNGQAAQRAAFEIAGGGYGMH